MHDQKLIRFGETHSELFHKFKHNPISDSSGNEQNCSTNQRPGNGGNLLECNQNLVRPGDALYEFAHRFWAKSNQLFVCRCTATAQRVRGQGMTEIHWSKTKSQSGQESSTMKLLGGGGEGGGWGLGLGLGWVGVGVGVRGWLEWGGGGGGWGGWRTWLLTKFELNLSCPVTLKGVVFVFGLTQSVASYILPWQWEP